MTLEILATSIWTIIGLLAVYLFIWLFAIFDAIRDENVIGLIILILFPFIGLLVYLIFLNKPSRKRTR